MGLEIGFGSSKSKTKKEPIKRTKEIKALFKSFMNDFYGGKEGGLSFEEALNQAANTAKNRYESQVYAPRQEYFGENQGLLNRLISETEGARKPIDIKFGGNSLLTYLPYTQKLSDLATQRAGLESDYLTGMGGDIGVLHDLALEPKKTLMDFYQGFLLPQELTRLGTTGTSKTSGSSLDMTGGISDEEAGAIAAAMMASSKKLKKDIKHLSDALDKVCQLSGKSFKWKHNDNQDAGVIAEEVERIIPEAVHKVNGIKCVSLAALVGYLIEAVKILTANQVHSLQGDTQ